METVQKVLEKKDIVRDVKARRVLNVSNKDSGITIQELENGVTIERIESLDVPVFLYGGQLTIHGNFKDDIGQNFRVAGYKSVFKNGNGSIGVRYVAIDAEKKIKLVEMSRLSDAWHVIIDSRGCQAYKSFRDKEQAIDCYKNVPEMFVGSKNIYQSIYGNFFVVIEIGAIYDKDFEEFAKAITGLTMEEYAKRKAEHQLKRDEERAAWEKEYNEEMMKKKIISENNKVWRQQKEDELGKVFTETKFNGNGTYVYPFASEKDENNKGFMIIKVKKGAFGKLYWNKKLVKEISEIKDFVPTEKASVMDELRVKIVGSKRLFIVG